MTRGTRGTDNGQAILSDAEVRQIRTLYLSGDWSWTELAEKFAVQKPTIQSILTGAAWHALLEEGEAEALAEMRAARRKTKKGLRQWYR